jgi:hypothetical protein
LSSSSDFSLSLLCGPAALGMNLAVDDPMLSVQFKGERDDPPVESVLAAPDRIHGSGRGHLWYDGHEAQAFAWRGTSAT